MFGSKEAQIIHHRIDVVAVLECVETIDNNHEMIIALASKLIQSYVQRLPHNVF